MTTDDDGDEGATIHVEAARKRAIVTWAPGVPVFIPWMSTIESLLAHPEFRPEFAVISDWRSATGAPDQAFVDAFLVFCRSIRRARRLTGPWAIVVAHDLDSGPGVGRSAELHAADGATDARVFKSLDEALAWTASALPR
jgi:hypothetical protein